MGHSVKKNRNNSRLSGMDGESRELVLDGKPISVKMLQNVWKKTPDSKYKGALMVNRKIKKETLVLDANTLLCPPYAMDVFPQSMLVMLKYYKHKKLKEIAYTNDPFMK